MPTLEGQVGRGPKHEQTSYILNQDQWKIPLNQSPPLKQGGGLGVGASQMTVGAENPPANAGDTRDMGLIPG